MPQRIVDILEGESLLNDATGLLALQFGVEMVVEGTTPTLGRGLLEFAWLAIGGVLVGLAIGFLVSWLERWVDDGPVEIALSLIVPYATYLAGDAVKASGVIAVVTCGLLVSRRSSNFFSPRVRLQAVAVWEALEFLLNGFVFVLIGLQLPYVLSGIRGWSRLSLVGYGLAFSGILLALRMLWMFPASQGAWWVRTRIAHQRYEKPAASQVFVLGWTGMRGVVALAAADSLPLTLDDGSPFPQRSLILFLTFSVILLTVVVQGLSLPWLIRALGLPTQDVSFCEEGQARQLMMRAAIDFLHERKNAAKEESEAHLYEDLLHQFEHKVTELELCGPDGSAPKAEEGTVTLGEVLLNTIRRQREELNLLRQGGRIGDAAHRTLERELDLSESRLA
jgi:CPA1 family monovalent cation:H+ antiporter